MRKKLWGIGLAAALAISAPGIADAEELDAPISICNSLAGARALFGWLDEGLPLTGALIVVNVERETCLVAKLKWFRDEVTDVEEFDDGAGKPYITVRLEKITAVELLGDWRPIPEWLEDFRYVFFPANSRFLPQAKASTCGNNCT